MGPSAKGECDSDISFRPWAIRLRGNCIGVLGRVARVLLRQSDAFSFLIVPLIIPTHLLDNYHRPYNDVVESLLLVRILLSEIVQDVLALHPGVGLSQRCELCRADDSSAVSLRPLITLT